MSAAISFGQACNCNAKEADIQMAVAMYKRCGLGPFGTVISFANQITGPLAPGADGTDGLGHFTDVHRDPLYLLLTCTLTWNDGTTYTETFAYDPNYCDMTHIGAGPAGSQFNPFNFTNVTAAYPNPGLIAGPLTTDTNGNPGPSPAFPAPDAGPNGPFYDGINNTNTFSQDKLNFTGTAQNWTDSGGRLHYGYKLTWTLTKPFTWAQYASCANAWLNGVSLQDGTLNPTKTYPGISGNGVKNLKLRYFCEFPKPNSDATYVNTIVVKADRTAPGGYVYGYPSQFPNYAGRNPNFGDWNWMFLPCGTNISSDPATGLGLNVLTGRYPLAANGMPFTSSPPGPPNSPILPVGGLPGAPALSGQYLFSSKSSVRARADMLPTAMALIYDPAGDKVEQVSSGVHAGAGEYIVTPDGVEGVGCLVALYGVESFCTTSDFADSVWAASPATPIMPQGGKPVFMARGASQTFYATTFDARGNWMRNASATWSLGQPGAGFGAVTPGCLVPAPDGLSAAFTAPNAPGEAILVVAIPGLTFQIGIVVVIN